MFTKKIVFAFLVALMCNFVIAQEHSAQVVDGIQERILLNHVDFSQHKNTGTVVVYICADAAGEVTQAQVSRTKSTIKDVQTLSKVANTALEMKFNAVKKLLNSCGEMTFNLDEKTPKNAPAVVNSGLRKRKIIGSRPTPPSTDVEAGDLTARNVLRGAKFNDLKQKGQVVIYVCADKYGRVIKAQTIKSQSTIKDDEILLEVTKRIQSQMKFSPGKQQDCMYYKVKMEG